MKSRSGAWWSLPTADRTVPPAAAQLFGDRLPLVARYAELLAGQAVAWGLLGPREPGRLWERHLLNCAVLTELLPPGQRVVDVGSGAGLPGIVLACARGDLRIDLVEPLERRVRFLDEAVAALGFGDRVRVVRGRAEDARIREQVGPTAWCTARAVAGLDRLVRWCAPLLAPGGVLLALKGRTAEQEIAAAAPVLRRFGASAQVRLVGARFCEEPVRVVVVKKGSP